MAMSCSRWVGSSERASASCLGLRVRARVCQVGLLRSGCGVVWEVVLVLVLEFVLWELGAGVGVGFVGWVVGVDVGELGLAVCVCVGAGVEVGV